LLYVYHDQILTEELMMNKKMLFNKTFVFWIIFVFSIIFTVPQVMAALPGSEAGAAAPSLEKIKKAGKLVVGTSADYPPYEFHLLSEKESDLVGIDIDIAKVIAGELGVELELKDLIFSRIFDALDAGQVDFAIAGLHPTEERKKIASFSDIYYQAIQSVVIRAENSEKIKTIEDLRGKKVGTQKDSIQEAMARTQISGAEFIVRETIEELIILLKKGLVDAIILEEPVAESYVRRDKHFAIIKCKKFDNMLGSAIAVKKGNMELLKEINRILEKLKKENKIKEFVENAKMLTNKR
jgi:arginine/lysine/histidine transporter system substrate-binding protein